MAPGTWAIVEVGASVKELPISASVSLAVGGDVGLGVTPLASVPPTVRPGVGLGVAGALRSGTFNLIPKSFASTTIFSGTVKQSD